MKLNRMYTSQNVPIAACYGGSGYVRKKGCEERYFSESPTCDIVML